MATIMLTGPDGRWVAAGHHGELTITVAAHNVDPDSLRLEPITVDQLLGPEPPAT